MHQTDLVRQRLSRDTHLLVAGQAVRGLGNGFTSAVLGAMLAHCGVGAVRAGILLATLIAGSAGASMIMGAFADRVRRRRSYALFFGAVSLAGAVVASDPPI